MAQIIETPGHMHGSNHGTLVHIRGSNHGTLEYVSGSNNGTLVHHSAGHHGELIVIFLSYEIVRILLKICHCFVLYTLSWPS